MDLGWGDLKVMNPRVMLTHMPVKTDVTVDVLGKVKECLLLNEWNSFVRYQGNIYPWKDFFSSSVLT